MSIYYLINKKLLILSIADIMDTLEKENLVLKKRNLEQQEQITLLERAMKTVNEERAISDSSRSQGLSSRWHCADCFVVDILSSFKNYGTLKIC